MSKSTRKLIQTCKLICTILLVVIVGLQFIPYWYGVYTKTSSELLTEEEYLTRLAEQNAAATEPEATEPEATEPEATEPEATDPIEPTEPTEPVKPVEPVVPALPAIDTTEPQGFGNCNDNVATIQEKLIALGYSVGAPGIDSIFGAYTRQAVIRFQADNGLVADGVVGPETAAAIDAAYAKLNVSTTPEPTPNPDPTPDPDPNPDPTEPTEPTEEETTAPTLDLGIEFYNPDTAPKDEPVLTKYSIASYIWLFKENHKNEIIYMPVLMLLFAVASVVTYVKNTYSAICSAFAVVAPAVGLIGFLTVPLYATGFQWVYILHIVANAITFVVTLGTLILRLVVFAKEVKKDREERKAKSSFANK